jgi:hypothetical protein
MNMFSPDRPWPDDLRPVPHNRYEQKMTADSYQHQRPSRGDVAPYYGNPGRFNAESYNAENYGGKNNMPRPEYNAPIPPGYWPDMKYRDRDSSSMGRMPTMYNAPGDTVFYPGSPQGGQ